MTADQARALQALANEMLTLFSITEELARKPPAPTVYDLSDALQKQKQQVGHVSKAWIAYIDVAHEE